MHLHVAFVLDSVVLHVDHVHIYKNCILVVSGYGQLRNFNLALLHVNHDFEVELELFLTVNRFLEAHLSVFELFDDILLFTLKEHNEVSQRAKSCLIVRFELLHLNSDLSLVNNALELLWIDFSKHMTITLKVVHFLLLHLHDLLFHNIFIDFVAGVEDTDMTLHLLFCIVRDHNSAVLFASLDKTDDLARI